MEGWMMDQQGPDEVRGAEGTNADLAAWCGKAFPDTDIYDAFYRMPLSCLAASGIPVPMREFDILFSRDRAVLRAFLEKAQGRLTNLRTYALFPGDSYLRFASKEAASWLTGEEAGPYRIRAFDGASFMLRRFLDIFQRDPEAMTEYEVFLLPRLIREYGGDSSRDARLALAFSDAYYKRVLALTREESAGAFSSPILAEALDLARAACDRERSHKTRKNLVRVLVRYSEYREMEGDHARALSLCEEALPLCNEDLDEEESPERTRLFLETAEALAGLCLHEKKYGMSGSLYQRCVSLRTDLVRQERTPEDFRALAALCGRAGYAMGETGHYDKAVLYYESCFSLWDLLLKEEPLREDLEEAEEDYEAAALFYSRRKSYDKARDCYEKALALERRLRDGSPEQDGLLADVCTRFAGFLIYDGNDSERARALLEEAFMICSLHESLFIRQMIIRDRIREHFG